MKFDEMFKRATGNDPFHYQREMAESEEIPSLLEVPTGMGKTAAAILSWLWRRRFAKDEVKKVTPRRLVYCLPMRVLVEQTRDCAVMWLHRLDILDGKAVLEEENGRQKLKEYDPWHGEDDPDKIRVHILMGGDVDRDWDMYPERDAILIGTQDMLLSRALNRGYAMSRYRWPVQFGLLNNDCLWVMDEVQLMGNGLGTTTQLQAFRRLFSTASPVRSLWMSATMHMDWLKTVDFEGERDAPGGTIRFDQDKDIESSKEMKYRWEALKPISKAINNSSALDELSKEILNAHIPHGRTLVILNTVKRARTLHDVLSKSNPKARLILLHSRYRPLDRKRIIKQLFDAPGDEGVIIVSTQVIEAGVDISAQVLFTELAPWPSLVQRFGRCNRLGRDNENSHVYWVDVPTAKKNNMAPPYEESDLMKARKAIESLNQKSVGPKALNDSMKRDDISKLDLYHYEHTHVIRQHDMHGLFAIEPDLAGGFTDISNFIRNREKDSDVQVYWRPVKKQPDPDMPALHHDEICRVRFFELSDFLGEKGFAWEWNYDSGGWRKRYANEIRPGMTLLLAPDQGGYDDNLGWSGNSREKPTYHETPTFPQEYFFYEPSSQNDWYSLPNHLHDAEREATDLINSLGLNHTEGGRAVILAAWWHDIGKAISKWQDAIVRYTAQLIEKATTYLSDNPSTEEMNLLTNIIKRAEQAKTVASPWAKLPNIREMIQRDGLQDNTKAELTKVLGIPFRPGLRHEAASAIAAWSEWMKKKEGWTALAVYLVACHHGKVRTVLRSTSTGDDVFGINDGDTLPAMSGWTHSEQPLDLSMKYIGGCGHWDEDGFVVETPSWSEMIAELLGPELSDDPDAAIAVPETEPRRLGPYCLAFWEALIRAADVKASRYPGQGDKQ